MAAPPSKAGATGSNGSNTGSSADPAAAESLFYEARTLMSRGQYTEACPKLEESLKLDDGIGTRFNLADCHEHVGKVASAWAGFLDVAGKAKLAGQADREKIARKRAAALESRLPKLVVDVEGSKDTSLEVRRDDVVLGSAAWGAAIPVDPGTHKVTATAPGKQAWESTVQVSEGKTTKVSVPRELAPAVVAATAAPVSGTTGVLGASGTMLAPSPTVAPNGVVAPQTAPPPSPQASLDAPSTTRLTSEEAFPPPVVEGRGKTQRAVGLIVGGAGIVSLGVAGAFGLRSINKHNDADPHCTGNLCDQEGVDLRNDARTAGNVATVTTIVGGAALVTGLTLFLTAPRDTVTTPSVGSARAHNDGSTRPTRVGSIRPTWQMGPTGGALYLQGAFP
jgi:hypothetical protein